MANLRADLSDIFEGTEISYNGYILPPEGLHVRASVTPVYDRAGKSKIYDRVVLTVDFVVGKDDNYSSGNDISVDKTVEAIRRLLTAQGKALNIVGYGFGGTSVRGRVSDINLGPKPLGFDWESLHGNLFARIIWSVEFNLPGCSNITFVTSGDLVSFDYSVSWGWDDLSGGIRNRTITGVAEMFTFVEGTLLKFSREDAANYITEKFPRLGGWDRKQNYDISEDRRFLSFTIEDSERINDVAIPEMMADLQITQGINSSLEKAYAEWEWTISASVLVFKTRNPGTSIAKNKALAFTALGRIVIDRLLRFKNKYYLTSNGNSQSVQLFVESVSINDYITSNGFDYTLSGRIFVTSTILFESTGFFQPIGGINTTWQQRNDYIKNQGIDAFTTDADLKAIGDSGSIPVINLCNNGSGFSSTSSEPNRNYPVQTQLVEDEKPTEEVSWLDYEYSVKLEDNNYTTYNIPLADSSPREEKERKDATKADESSPVSDPLGSGVTSENALTSIVSVHNYTEKNFTVVLSGYAKRLGYRINSPNLISYGGMKAVKIGKDQITEREGKSRVDRNGKDVRTYTVRWRKMYILTIPNPDKPVSKTNPAEPQHDRYVTDVPDRFKNRK